YADVLRSEPLPFGAAEVRDLLARQDAHLLGAKALLLRTHGRLEEGLGSEVELALLAVWLEGASPTLGGLEEAVRRSRTPLPATPALGASAGPPVTVYTGFLAAPVAYGSGDFLVKSAGPLQPRYTPEMVQTGPRLSAYHRELRGLLTAQFGGLRDG